MPLWENDGHGCVYLNKDVLRRLEKALEKYQLSMLDLAQAAKIMEKQIPDVKEKNDNYGNDYFECPDCGKKYTYRHFDGYCEDCGKRMIW